jgi:transposase
MGAPQKAEWREERRTRAWNVKEQGWTQKESDAALGVTEGAVSQWIKRGRDKGEEALKASPPPGVPTLLSQAASAYGFRGDVWTASRVAKVIEQCFGVQDSRDRAGAIMRKTGWSPHKPEEKASQRDEEAMAAWKTERGEVLKKSPGGETNDCLGG